MKTLKFSLMGIEVVESSASATSMLTGSVAGSAAGNGALSWMEEGLEAFFLLGTHPPPFPIEEQKNG